MKEKYWTSINQSKPFYGFILEFVKNFVRQGNSILSSNLHLKLHDFITQETKRRFKNFNNKSLFDTVYFELRTRCSGRCPFCAASIQNETRQDETMQFETYKHVVGQLSELKFSGTIAWHVNSEPLLIKNIDEYVAFARKSCPDAWLQILSNGRSLNPINGKKLIESGINEISLNIYNDDFHAPTPKNILKFEREVLEKKFQPSEILSGFKDKNLFGKFIKYNKFKRLLNVTMSNRAGTSPNKKSNQVLPNLGFCQYPFTQFNVTANGKVSHCCADLRFALPMGNVKNQKVIDIWHGEKFNRIRNNLLESKRQKLPMCSKCDFYGMKTNPRNPLRKLLFRSLMTE